ncbi:MAG TPA: MFS transporter [Candidatus Bathyarchaeia archaeon]|nr:MFS transporter [Candidatus Bathyarchaeia archaeon]
MWRLGFFFHEMAFGLLSVFIPLYLVTPAIGGSLVDIGIMTSLALAFSIPASFFWGYICDRTRRYKRYILLSFFSSAIILFLFTLPFSQNIAMFILLYVVMSVLHVAHEAPKNVLIAEHYSREEWEHSFSFYEGLTEIGWFLGLVLGFAFAYIFSLNVVASYTLYLCSALSLVAFLLSIFLIADPLMIFERRLVGIERKLDYTFRGVENSTRLLDGLPVREKFRAESFFGFGLGLALFSLASSLFFTPLPIFFLQPPLSLPVSLIFVVYMLNSGGAMAGYFFIGRRATSIDAKKQMRRVVLLRSFLVFLLVGVVQFAFSPTLLAGAILVLLGFAYAVYYILMISLSMELIPAGRAGLFDVLVGIGGATGSFFGPFLAQMLGYLPQFLVAGALFFAAFVVLKIFS